MPTARSPLSRERIAVAALAFVDARGESALSMRKLGAELGVEAMSLYNHVANKDDLLETVGDLLYREILDRYDPAPGATWQDEARLLSRLFRAVASEHPAAIPILTDRVIPSTVKLEFMQAVWTIFTKAGFDLREASVVFNTVASWVIGSIRTEFGLMRMLEEQAGSVTHDDVPAEYHPVVDFTVACLTWTPDERFERGLDMLLDGIEARLRAVGS